VRVESATTGDLDALVEAWIALATEQRDHDSHLFADADAGRIRESMAHHVVADTCLVARPTDEAATGSRFLGFVTFSVDADDYVLDVDRGTVENIHVDPDHHGEGVGAALLAAAEAALADRGVDVVSLEVMAANDRAREFYDREGYGHHRVVMEKRVDVETDTKANLGE